MYTLRIPFELPPGYTVSESEDFVQFGHLDYRLKQEVHRYVFVIRGFPTEEAAEQFLQKAWSGFSWFLLSCGMAATWPREAQTLAENEDPATAARNVSESMGGLDVGDELHGIIDGSRAAVFETEKNFRVLCAGRASLTLGSPAERFFDHFNQGIGFDSWEAGLADHRLCVALDLYGAFFAETTTNARFLTLIMVLEALTEPVGRPQIAIQLIQDFHQRIDETLADIDADSPEGQSLEALKREIDFRKYNSIRSQVRTLVSSTLSQAGDEDAEDKAREALRLYDARSELLHTGQLDPGELELVSASARSLVEHVLRARFLRAARQR